MLEDQRTRHDKIFTFVKTLHNLFVTVAFSMGKLVTTNLFKPEMSLLVDVQEQKISFTKNVSLLQNFKISVA